MKKLKYLTKLKSRDTGYFTLTVKEKTKWILPSVDGQVTRQPGADENKIRRLWGSLHQTCQQSHTIVLWSLVPHFLANTVELCLGS